ncbi:MAG: winged helix-turn-helix domain-containing protein [Acidimicrobiales bacterium]
MLANPVRLGMLQYLAVSGPGTATTCAAVVGVTPTSASYHLRRLAEHGLVKEVPSEDGRERPWELVAAPSLQVSSGPASTQESAAARTAFQGAADQRDLIVINEFAAGRHLLPAEWQEAAAHVQDIVSVTVEELAQLAQELATVVETFHQRRPSPTEGDRRLVYISLRAVPWLKAQQPGSP